MFSDTSARNEKRRGKRYTVIEVTKRFLHLHLLVSDSLPQTVAQHLRWIMQKDLLGQDVFLIGPPGPLRRSLAMQYLVSTHITHMCID